MAHSLTMASWVSHFELLQERQAKEKIEQARTDYFASIDKLEKELPAMMEDTKRKRIKYEECFHALEPYRQKKYAPELHAIIAMHHECDKEFYHPNHQADVDFARKLMEQCNPSPQANGPAAQSSASAAASPKEDEFSVRRSQPMPIRPAAICCDAAALSKDDRQLYDTDSSTPPSQPGRATPYYEWQPGQVIRSALNSPGPFAQPFRTDTPIQGGSLASPLVPFLVTHSSALSQANDPAVQASAAAALPPDDTQEVSRPRSQPMPIRPAALFCAAAPLSNDDRQLYDDDFSPPRKTLVIPSSPRIKPRGKFVRPGTAPLSNSFVPPAMLTPLEIYVRAHQPEPISSRAYVAPSLSRQPLKRSQTTDSLNILAQL